MRPTAKAVEFFLTNGWSADNLAAAGYTLDGQPSPAILEALRASSWTDEMMVEHGMATTDEPPKADAKVARYVALRDEVDRIKKALKAQEKPLLDEMSTIQQELSTILHETGQSKMGSDAGTFFYVDKTTVSVKDFEAYTRWFVDTILNRLFAKGFMAEGKSQYDATDAAMDSLGLNFMTQAVRKEAVVEYTNEHGNPPKGLAIETWQEVQVRRANAK